MAAGRGQGGPADGVWLVELSSVSAPAQVQLAAAATFDVALAPGVSPLDALCERLADADVLVVVDNCEHVADAAAELAERLLQAAPRLCLLVTSREPLYVAGELVWPVPPLEPADAVRLFDHRARLAHPGFVLGSRDRAVVGEVCDRLDRLPLAVELAAARVRLLAPEEILSHLGDRFRLLRGGPRTVRRMHEALETTIGWSYDLLGDAEQALFRRMAVFRGAVGLRSIEAVCSPELPDDDVMELVGRLVDRSLVMTEGRSGASRYRLLESLRAYGSVRLDAAGESSAFHRAHAVHFLARAEEAEGGLSGPEELASLEMLAGDYDNLRAALAWSADNEPELLMRLCCALGALWWRRGPLEEGSSWLASAVGVDSGATLLRADVLIVSARAAIPFARHETARVHVAEALEIFSRLSDVSGMARSANMLAWVDLWVADLDSAELGFTRGLAWAVEACDEESERLARWGLGHVCWRREELVAAKVHFEEGLRLARKLGAPSILADALDALGHVTHSAGDLAGASDRFEEALFLYSGLGDRSQIAHEHNNLADVALDGADSKRARPHLVRAMEMIRDLGIVGATAGAAGVYSCLESFARLAVLTGQHRRALRLAGAAAALRTSLDRGLAPPWQARLDSELAPARYGLGADKAEQAWREGSQLGADQAISEALVGALLSGEQPLSPRELEIAGLVESGLSNPEIARQLVLSPRTVDSHVQNIKTKLGMRSRVELATWMADRSAGRARLRGSTDARVRAQP